MILLVIVWLFFSLPWMFMAGIFSFASCDPDHCSAGMYPVMLAQAGAFTFLPPMVFGAALFGLRQVVSGMSWLTFWAFVRVVMYIVGGVSGGIQLCAMSEPLRTSAHHSFIGLNAFTMIGIPLILGAVVWQQSSKLPAGLTFAQKFNALFEKLLFYPKKFVAWLVARWNGTPAA